MEKVDFYCELFKAVYERVSRVCPEGARDVALKIVEEIAKDVRSERGSHPKLRLKLKKRKL